jgi:cell division inhibitor SepF
MSGLWDRTLVYLGLREESDEVHDEVEAARGDPAVATFDADADPHAERAPRRPAERRRTSAAEPNTEPTAERTSEGERARAGRPAVTRTGGGDRTTERPRPSSERTRGAAAPSGSSRSPGGTEPRRGQSTAAAAARAIPETAPDRPVRREPGRADSSNVTRLPNSEVHVLPVTRGASVHVAIVIITAFDEVEQVGRRVRAGEPVLFDLRDADATTARRVVDFASGIVYGLHGRLDRVASRAFLVRPRGVEVPGEERRRLAEHGYRVPAGSEA